ncbi:MAG: hypothetical protein ACPGUD_02565 [Parashewanella sp.]
MSVSETSHLNAALVNKFSKTAENASNSTRNMEGVLTLDNGNSYQINIDRAGKKHNVTPLVEQHQQNISESRDLELTYDETDPSSKERVFSDFSVELSTDPIEVEQIKASLFLRIVKSFFQFFSSKDTAKPSVIARIEQEHEARQLEEILNQPFLRQNLAEFKVSKEKSESVSVLTFLIESQLSKASWNRLKG